MLKLDQFLWMAEAEGIDSWVSTPTAKLNASINDFISAYYKDLDINDTDLQERILNKHNLSLYDLSEKEKNYIKQEIERRI